MGLFKKLFSRKKTHDDFLNVEPVEANQIVIDNLIELTSFALKRSNVSNAIYYEVGNSLVEMLVTNSDGQIITLDLNDYIHHDDEKMTNMINENESLSADGLIDKKFIKEEVKTRSKEIIEAHNR